MLKTEVLGGPDTTAKVIPYETLAQATHDFDLKQKVGDGRFGSVYQVSTHFACFLCPQNAQSFFSFVCGWLVAAAVVKQKLDWRSRVDILVGTATGLAYLHEECDSIFAHGDIKAVNIMLDKTMQPKIADWGLAALFRHDQGEVKPRNMVSVYVPSVPSQAFTT